MEPLPFNWQSYLTLPQAIGFIAFAIEVWALSQKSDQRFLQRQLIVSVSWVVHFAFMQSWTGCMIAAINMARYVIVLRFMPSLSWRPYVAGTVIAAGFSITLSVAQHWMDWTPWIASVIATLAIFYLKQIQLRIAFLFVSACWLLYNIFVQSIGGMMAEVVLISTNLLTIMRIAHSNSPMPPPSQE